MRLDIIVRVSIVVPTYKRPHLLDRCLGALLSQEYPAGTFEIVVADDGDDAATRDLVQWRRQQPSERPLLRYVRVQGRHGPAAARNAGWRAANGSIIAFTDDDCVPLPDWLREGVAALGGRYAAVWGRVVVPISDEPTDYERDAARLAGAGFATANCFCRRQVLTAVDGFDEGFTAAWREDSDFYFSLIEHSLDVAPAPRATVVHPIRPAGWGVSLQQQRKIQFDALLYKKHPTLYRMRVRRAPRWDYYCTSALLVGGLIGWGVDYAPLAWSASAAWLTITARLCSRRLQRTSHRLSHVMEMLLTSALIPPVAIFWRMVGAVKYRVMFF
ncbi:MAG: glycosyltransferase [Gammaproteobacteria bacterium]|nr:glycosyltransferase [Gammaproteobacteria bacterium]